MSSRSTGASSESVRKTGSAKAGSGSASSTRAGRKPGPGSGQKTAPVKGPAGSARARLAAQQQEAERRRRRMMWVILPLALVVIAVATLIIVRFAMDKTAASTATDPSVPSKVTSVPVPALNQVGAGEGVTPPSPINAPALTADGKPRVLYVGAEYCPFCAAERWSMVVALSRFGTFTNLGQTQSSSTDSYPNTPTLSFHGASYKSSTISFTGAETEAAQGVPLDKLSPADEQLVNTYNAPPYVPQAGSIPFVDIGGKYVISGASYSPQLLQGKTHAEVAAALSDPNSAIAKSALGAATQITAAICATTGNKPADVCTSPGVQAGAKALQ